MTEKEMRIAMDKAEFDAVKGYFGNIRSLFNLCLKKIKDLEDRDNRNEEDIKYLIEYKSDSSRMLFEERDRRKKIILKVKKAIVEMKEKGKQMIPFPQLWSVYNDCANIITKAIDPEQNKMKVCEGIREHITANNKEDRVMLEISKIHYNWIGREEYNVAEVGKYGVTEIIEHSSEHEGDRLFYDIIYGEVNEERIFNPNRVFFREQKV